jgi:hypothetical protein
MAVEDAIVALRENWSDVAGRLDAMREQELRGFIAEIGGDAHEVALTQIVELIVAELPPGHPVLRALAEGYLFRERQVDWRALRADLLALALQAPGTAASAAPGTILAEVANRLLRAPSLTEDEVRLRGVEPADPDVVRLKRPDGERQWPSFQFAQAGGLLPVVRTVNELLGAATDPLGVADWWLGVNAWLDARPSELIGVRDELIIRAARAVAEEV